MNASIIVLIGTQILFSIGDLLARVNMQRCGFTMAAFCSAWFIAYSLIRVVATFGQLYVFTTTELGKTTALFGALGIILSNVIGLLLLQEVLSPIAYISVALVVVAFFLLALL